MGEGSGPLRLGRAACGAHHVVRRRHHLGAILRESERERPNAQVEVGGVWYTLVRRAACGVRRAACGVRRAVSGGWLTPQMQAWCIVVWRIRGVVWRRVACVCAALVAHAVDAGVWHMRVVCGIGGSRRRCRRVARWRLGRAPPLAGGSGS
eukprot:5505332-Prymnesium_polylepis.1